MNKLMLKEVFDKFELDYSANFDMRYNNIVRKCTFEQFCDAIEQLNYKVTYIYDYVI